jgi:hypothetical protein
MGLAKAQTRVDWATTGMTATGLATVQTSANRATAGMIGMKAKVPTAAS